MPNLNANPMKTPPKQEKKFGEIGLRIGSAPRRAIGNFTTHFDSERTRLAAMHNLAEARRSGNPKLIALFERHAVEVVERMKRPIKDYDLTWEKEAAA